MIRHIVMWKFKEGEKENMMRFRERLLALGKELPEVRSMEVGINIRPSERSYDAVLVSEFASMEDLASYQQNPRHLEISAFCKSSSARPVRQWIMRFSGGFRRAGES